MTSILKEGETCWCCGLPLSECRWDKVPLPVPDKEDLWRRIEGIFGNRGLPSCGMTDAERLGGSDDRKPAHGTVYIGGQYK